MFSVNYIVWYNDISILPALMVSTIYKLAILQIISDYLRFYLGFYSYMRYFVDSEVLSLSAATFQNKNTSSSHLDVSAVSRVPLRCMCAVLCWLFVPIPSVRTDWDYCVFSSHTAPGNFGHKPVQARMHPRLHWHGEPTASRRSCLLLFFVFSRWAWHIA